MDAGGALTCAFCQRAGPGMLTASVAVAKGAIADWRFTTSICEPCLNARAEMIGMQAGRDIWTAGCPVKPMPGGDYIAILDKDADGFPIPPWGEKR